eukprot:82546-Chlamydomonas_euryale.AAC.6
MPAGPRGRHHQARHVARCPVMPSSPPLHTTQRNDALTTTATLTALSYVPLSNQAQPAALPVVATCRPGSSAPCDTSAAAAAAPAATPAAADTAAARLCFRLRLCCLGSWTSCSTAHALGRKPVHTAGSGPRRLPHPAAPRRRRPTPNNAPPASVRRSSSPKLRAAPTRQAAPALSLRRASVGGSPLVRDSTGVIVKTPDHYRVAPFYDHGSAATLPAPPLHAHVHAQADALARARPHQHARAQGMAAMPSMSAVGDAAANDGYPGRDPPPAQAHVQPAQHLSVQHTGAAHTFRTRRSAPGRGVGTSAGVARAASAVEAAEARLLALALALDSAEADAASAAEAAAEAAAPRLFGLAVALTAVQAHEEAQALLLHDMQDAQLSVGAAADVASALERGNALQLAADDRRPGGRSRRLDWPGGARPQETFAPVGRRRRQWHEATGGPAAGPGGGGGDVVGSGGGADDAVGPADVLSARLNELKCVVGWAVMTACWQGLLQAMDAWQQPSDRQFSSSLLANGRQPTAHRCEQLADRLHEWSLQE